MTNNKIILRMCAVTRQKIDRKFLFRIVKTPTGVEIEKDKHIPGRGAYLSKDKKVIETAKKKKILSRQLKTDVHEEIYDQLLNLI